MTTAATSLLGLALPVTGELSGTWGTTVNDSITSLLDTAIAGTTTLSTDGDVTLTTTTLAANQARQAILLCSGARTAIRTITAPAQSKIYTIINATTGGYAVKLVGVGPTTGLTIPNGASAVVAWNGSDFIEIGSSTIGNLTVNGNLTVTGSTTLSGGTANGVAYLNGSKVVTTGSALTFDGTNFGVGTTPPTGAGNYRAINAGAALMYGNTGSAVTALNMNGDINDKYIIAGAASSLVQSGGAFTFYNAASGSAGGAISYTQLMKLDSSGNLGLGVTPSAWSGLTAYQVKSGSFANNSTLDRVYLLSNAYYNAGFKYVNSNPACRFDVEGTSGSFAWYTAPSGTAGNAISFTQAMTLDASGNLGIGTSSPTAKLTIQSAGNSGLIIRQNTSYDRFRLFVGDGTGGYTADENYITSQNTGLHFMAGASGTTEVMLLTSSGNLGIGTTSPAGRLDVNSTAGEVIYSSSDRSTNGQYISGIIQRAKNSSSSYVSYAAVYGYITSNTASSESGALTFWTMGSGSVAERARITSTGGFAIGTTTDPGLGNIILPGTSGTIFAGSTTGSRSYIELYNNSTGDMSIATTYTTAAIKFLTGGTTTPTERARIDSSGNLGVGVTSPAARLDIYSPSTTAATPIAYMGKALNDSTTSNVLVRFLINSGGTGSGQINANGASAAAFGTYSDERLKENIETLDSQLSNVCSLRPVEFDYKDGSGHQIGFIAQEMQNVYPDCIGEDSEGMLTITGWSKTEARLVKAIQEQQALITQLTERITALESK